MQKSHKATHPEITVTSTQIKLSQDGYGPHLMPAQSADACYATYAHLGGGPARLCDFRTFTHRNLQNTRFPASGTVSIELARHCYPRMQLWMQRIKGYLAIYESFHIFAWKFWVGWIQIRDGQVVLDPGRADGPSSGRRQARWTQFCDRQTDRVDGCVKF